jgi:predicted DCC family thiol-disulfide oxidoreductase YuxK
MQDRREIQVTERPGRPLLVFDGACAFCRQWVERWRGVAGERVEYRPWQDVSDRFPEIGEERFRTRVWLIEPDGRATAGARAVFRLLAEAGEKRWLGWVYENLPAFAAVAEGVYDLVAGHRRLAAAATRQLWGTMAERPRYRRTRAIFLRAMGGVYLTAFWSMAIQVDGLIGSRGIVPVRDFLRAIGPMAGGSRYWQFPTLLWLDSSDRALHLLSWGGVVISGLLVAGAWPRVCLVLLWLSYLSIVVVGQPFFAFQWDMLLLESGMLAALFAPGGPWLGRAGGEPSRGVLWLIRWLVFRLMFLSGVVKLASGDPTWWAWEAMKYHYETQPLPAWTSWWMHQLPPWFHAASVGYVFWAELIAPFLVFGPRRVRMMGFWSIVILQVLITATGNYGFFNVLTIVLCLSLIEDRDWERLGGRRRDDRAPVPAPAAGGWWRRSFLGLAGAVIVIVTTMEGLDRSGWSVIFPWPLEALRSGVAPFQSMSAYGLFAVMTTDRPEVLVEGSRDGRAWVPYGFRWKPGDVQRRPRFTTPHMPRLDWQMWFAALARDCRSQPWFLAFERRLLEGSPTVLALLRGNPFPEGPPRYLRARLDQYRFTGRGEQAWWRRDELGFFCPPLGLSRSAPHTAP